jgi:hypothetical protein
VVSGIGRVITIRRSYVKGFVDISRNLFSCGHFSSYKIECEAGMAYAYPS